MPNQDMPIEIGTKQALSYKRSRRNEQPEKQIIKRERLIKDH